MTHSVYHTDFWSKDDHLNFSDYRPVLSQILIDADTPLTLGLFGSWGTGKTTLLKMLQHDVETKGGSDVRTIWFTAWKYDRYDALWRAFILRVLDQLYPRADTRDPWEKRPRLNIETIKDKKQKQLVSLLQKMEESVYKTVEWEEFSKISIDALQLAVNAGKGVSEIASAFIPIAGAVKPLSKLIGLDQSVSDEVANSASAIKREFNQYRREQLNSLEQFENLFCEALQLSLGEHGRLVVFVDDLDRCLPEKAIEILETIKLFLETEKTVFVIGMDQEIVEKGIEVRYRDYLFNQRSKESEIPIRGDIYLQKIIQIPFYLPPMDGEDISNFITKLENNRGNTNDMLPSYVLSKYDSQRVVDPLTLKIFSQGLTPNPRQIKRAINIFKLLQGIALIREENGSLPRNSVSWPLLAKTVVIQTQYPILYNQWRQEPRLVAWLEDAFTKRNSGIQLDLDSDDVKSKMVRPYLKVENFAESYLLEHLFAENKLISQNIGRNRANFKDLTPEELSFYLRLAGSIAFEGVTAQALGDWWMEIKSGEKLKVRKSVEYLLKDTSKEIREKSVWLLSRHVQSFKLDENVDAQIVWAEALDKLGNVDQAQEIYRRHIGANNTIKLSIVESLGELEPRPWIIKVLYHVCHQASPDVNSAVQTVLLRLIPVMSDEIKNSLDASSLDHGNIVFSQVLLKTGATSIMEFLSQVLVNRNDLQIVVDVLRLFAETPNQLGREIALTYLSDSREQVRSTAVLVLGKTHFTDDLALLGHCYDEDASNEVRSEIIKSMAEFGEKSVPRLVNLLFSPEHVPHQLEITNSLIAIGAASIHYMIVEYPTNLSEETLLAPADTWLDGQYFEILAKTTKEIGEPAFQLLKTLVIRNTILRKKDSVVVTERQVVIKLLSYIANEPSIEILISLLVYNGLQEDVFDGLVLIGVKIFNVIVDSLPTEYNNDYFHTITILFHRIGAPIYVLAANHLSHPNPEVRRILLRVLGEAKQDLYTHQVYLKTNDKNIGVVKEALTALANINSERSLNSLLSLKFSVSTSREELIALIRALGVTKNPRIVVPLITTAIAAHDSDSEVKEAAIESMLAVDEGRALSIIKDYAMKYMFNDSEYYHGKVLPIVGDILSRFQSTDAKTFYSTLAFFNQPNPIPPNEN